METQAMRWSVYINGKASYFFDIALLLHVLRQSSEKEISTNRNCLPMQDIMIVTVSNGRYHL